MALNFQKLEAYNVDIENFGVDVSQIVDRIFVGPQGELLERIEAFNDAYNTNIGSTKAFTLKPGGYNELKKAYQDYVLRFDMKPRGVSSIFDRMQQYRWREANFKRNILNIETRMKNLKASGMRWQDNTDQVQEEFNRLKSNIINTLDIVREMYPQLNIDCKVVPVNQNRQTRRWNSGRVFPSDMYRLDNITDYIVVFYIKINNLEMTVHVMDTDSSIDRYTLPMDDVIVASGTYLLPLINRQWGRTEAHTTNAPSSMNHFLEAIYLSPMGQNYHPYIGCIDDSYQWELGHSQPSGNICTGNMDGDIRNSLLNNDLLSHITNIVLWISNYYVPQTHPLNKIRKARYFGHNVKFLEWMNDLNTVSSTVFDPYEGMDEGGDLPQDCGFGGWLSSRMHEFASGYTTNYRRFNSTASTTLTSQEPEYGEKLQQYIQKVKAEDFPCANCVHLSECEQSTILYHFFDDDTVDEIDEAILGMVYEEYEHTVHVLRRLHSRRGTMKKIHFAEESIVEAWRDSHVSTYQNIYTNHRIVSHWFTKREAVDGRDIDISSDLYLDRYNLISTSLVRSSEKDAFIKEYVDTDRDFHWGSDSLKVFAKTVRASLDKDPVVLKAINEAVQRSISSEPSLTQEPAPESTMSAEERAMRWAINNGGAQNL